MSNEKQRILIIAANGLGKTGVPNVIFQVARALIDHFFIDVVVFNGEDYYAKMLEEMGVKIYRVNEKEPKDFFKRLLWRLFVEKRIHKKIFSNLFKKNDYFAIHSFKEYDSAYIFKAASKHKIYRRIIHCNNEILAPSRLISKIIFNHKKKLIKKYTTQVIGVSDKCLSFSYPCFNYIILYNTYNEVLYNSNVKNRLRDNELVLTQIATYSSRKNQLFSLNVFKHILVKYPTARLNLVGLEVEKGYLDKIIDTIERLCIGKSVNIIDGNSGFINVLENTSYVILPSLHEGAPIALVEAQACGIHCFTSTEVTREVDCLGVTYIVLNELDWANSIMGYFEACGNKRKKYDVSKFSINHFNSSLLEIYGIK